MYAEWNESGDDVLAANYQALLRFRDDMAALTMDSEQRGSENRDSEQSMIEDGENAHVAAANWQSGWDLVMHRDTHRSPSQSRSRGRIDGVYTIDREKFYMTMDLHGIDDMGRQSLAALMTGSSRGHRVGNLLMWKMGRDRSIGNKSRWLHRAVQQASQDISDTARWGRWGWGDNRHWGF